MKSRTNIPGFTLIELLVGASITLVLTGLLLTIAVNMLSQWQRQAARGLVEAQAQLVLDFLERDLNGAFLRTELGGTWLAVDFRDQSSATLTAQGWDSTGMRTKPTANSASLLVGTTGAPGEAIADDRFGVGGAWLRFFTMRDATSSEISSPAAVSYQLLRRPVSSVAGADRRYVFFRSIARVARSSGGSNGTFEAGYDLTSASYNAAGSFQADVGTIYAPNSADALASNVVDFGVRLSVEDASAAGGLRRLFPTAANPASYRLTSSTPIPTVAEIVVRIVSESGAAQLQNIEAGRVVRPPEFASDDEWWWSVAIQNSQVFVRRVPLVARNSP